MLSLSASVANSNVLRGRNVIHFKNTSVNRSKKMNEDTFNMSLRKFLTKVGVTSQREIEHMVQEAIESGKLKGNEKLDAKAILKIGGIELETEINGKIELE